MTSFRGQDSLAKMTDRQMDRQTDEHTYRQTNGQTDRRTTQAYHQTTGITAQAYHPTQKVNKVAKLFIVLLYFYKISVSATLFKLHHSLAMAAYLALTNTLAYYD